MVSTGSPKDPFYDYGSDAFSGLWRAFAPETTTAERAYEGGTTPSTKTTTYTYGSYGNPNTIQESDQTGAVVRTTTRYYVTRDDATSYIVDRVWGENVSSPSGLLSSVHSFYDGTSMTQQLGMKGELTQIRSYTNLPLSCCSSSVVLKSSDTTYAYDAYGNRTTVTTYPGYGTLQNNVYSAPGNGSAAQTITTGYDYTFHAWPQQVQSPTGNGVTLNEQATYDYRGLITSVTDPNNNLTSVTYDTFSRPSTLVKPGDSSTYPTVTWYYYDTEQPVRQVIALREDAGQAYYRPITHFFDGLGREVQTKVETAEGSQNSVTDLRYDGYGRTIKRSQPRYDSGNFWGYIAPDTDANERWTTTTYDSLGRISQMVQPDGSMTRSMYGVVQEAAAGNSWVRYADTVDANRHRTQQRNDSLGRLINVYEMGGNCDGGTYPGYTCSGSFTSNWSIYAKTTYGYNALDQLIGVIDQLGNTTNLYYDSLGRKTQMRDPDMGTWSYAYDPQGNLKQQTDARGIQTNFTYDYLNRATDASFSNGDPAFAWCYDESWSANGKGQRTSTCFNPAGGCPTWSGMHYDARGQVVNQGITIAGVNRSLNWSYDSADRLRTIGYPSGRVLRYTYDAAWRPVTACLDAIGCLVLAASYTALDQPAQVNYGNSRIEVHSYTGPMARLDRLQYGDLIDRNYGYDWVGNVKTIADNRIGQTQQFQYDDRDRLTQAWTTGSAANSYSEGYDYNQIGNFAAKAGVSYAYPPPGSARPHTPTSVGGQPMSYDANGNLTLGAGHSYSWNGSNRAAAIMGPDGVIETYGYDADGERVSRTRSGTVTRYYRDLVEEDQGGEQRELYPFNGRTIALLKNSDFHFLAGDHLGSVSAVTNGVGTLVSQQEYTPWGAQRGTGTTTGLTSLNYTGQRKDATGLLYYHARFYDPVLGRFVSPDPVVPGNDSGGMDGVQVRPLTVDAHEPGFLASVGSENRQAFWFQTNQQGASPFGPVDPQALNRYSYVQNNPIRWTDPTGHSNALPDDPNIPTGGSGSGSGSGGGGGGGGGGGVPVTEEERAAARPNTGQQSGNGSNVMEVAAVEIHHYNLIHKRTGHILSIDEMHRLVRSLNTKHINHKRILRILLLGRV